MKKRIATSGLALSRRTFFGQATAATLLAAVGCLPRKGSDAPCLKVGVLSDVHLLLQKDSMHSDVYFEKTLRWYDEQKADEVIFLDITATSDDRATTVDLASRASEELHLPYTVGGGFRSVADIRRMIAAGADKVSVNSAAVKDPSLITQAAQAFGTQAMR